ncbi:MAG: hypothetical protein SVM79_02610 [Chloroflexota bacterium]|nr:hypothetical protein [Chloroflexota bacterium]
MSPIETNLYLDQMDLRRYCPQDSEPIGDAALSESVEDKICLDDCPLLSLRQRHAFRLVLEAGKHLPSNPPITVPQPVEPELISLNDPDENALVLVTANNSLTLDVLTIVWSQGITPAYFVLIDCLGNTVDMAMVFGEFKPERLAEALEKSNLDGRLVHRNIIVPGLTATLAEDFKKATGWDVEVGPVCAAELPLFLGDRWFFLD